MTGLWNGDWDHDSGVVGLAHRRRLEKQLWLLSSAQDREGPRSAVSSLGLLVIWP
jgi:hypothetical protein